MKRLIVLISIVLLFVSGCASAKTQMDSNTNNGLQVDMVQTSMGSIDGTFNKQKLSYDMTISNKNSVKIQRESVYIVLNKWVQQNKLGGKITQIKFNEKSFEIKGYVAINTKGMTKKQIVSKRPFITGVNFVTNVGKKVFVKR